MTLQELITSGALVLAPNTLIKGRYGGFEAIVGSGVGVRSTETPAPSESPCKAVRNLVSERA